MKMVIVGDGAVGKTCLFTRYRTNTFPEDYVPTVFENFVEEVPYKKTTIFLQMWDTAGQEDFDRIRNKAYADTDVFLVCYSVDDQNSYENVEVKWVPEVTHFCKEAKIILAATKVDRRKDKTCNCLASSKCQELANRVGAAGHMECSSKTGTNVKELFKLAIDVVKGQAEVKEKKQDGCYIV